MDIGTAKPSPEEQHRIPHALIDIANPDERFTAGDFKPLAQRAIADIADRGKLPILVGGTGLYIDAVLYDFDFRGPADPERRAALERLSVPELQALLRADDIQLPVNDQNPRHLIRSLETAGKPDARQELRSHTLVIGLDVPKAELERRVVTRVDAMLSAGLEFEALGLAQRYGWDVSPMLTIGYREFREYEAGTASIQEVRRAIIMHTLQYAKRQRTWFRRNNSIHWIRESEEAVALVTTFLNK
jgi:tRNA dimethylallyltransferase